MYLVVKNVVVLSELVIKVTGLNLLVAITSLPSVFNLEFYFFIGGSGFQCETMYTDV